MPVLLTSPRIGNTRKIRNWSATTSSTFAGNMCCKRNSSIRTTIENHCQRERRRRSSRTRLPCVACNGERARRQIVPSKAVINASSKVSSSMTATPLGKSDTLCLNFTKRLPRHTCGAESRLAGSPTYDSALRVVYLFRKRIERHCVVPANGSRQRGRTSVSHLRGDSLVWNEESQIQTFYQGHARTFRGDLAERRQWRGKKPGRRSWPEYFWLQFTWRCSGPWPCQLPGAKAAGRMALTRMAFCRERR